MSEARDQEMMRRCIELALLAEGRTSPNPLVGAVVLDASGNVVGEGYHKKAGQPHAEVFAFDAAGDRAKGGTLYVNLEPCSHFGKTPPCADRVISAGVTRAVIGMQDPNPKVCGAGIQKLREAGIAVEFSSLHSQCAQLNHAFLKRIETGLPWVALKIASTLDGRIADRYGTSRWVTGSEARRFVHQLRNKMDCVLIGANTAVKDDPELNVRDIDMGRDPHRAVIDPNRRVEPTARMFTQGGEAVRKFIFTLNAEPQIDGSQTEVVVSEKIVLTDCLRHLAQNGIQSVLCEGGGRLAASLLEEELVDEIFWFVAAKLLVDDSAVPALAGIKPRAMRELIELMDLELIQLGKDFLFHALVPLDLQGETCQRSLSETSWDSQRLP